MITTREGLKQYALRKLGAPVLEINTDDDQLEDRIDDALEYWHLYHYEGVERMYLKQQIRASSLTIQEGGAVSGDFSGLITGQTSGATAYTTGQINDSPSDTVLLVKDVSGTFQDGEEIKDIAENSANLAEENSVFIGEYDNKYVTVADAVYGVTRVLPFSGSSSSKSLFDVQYQLRLHDLYDLTSTSIIYYKMVMSHLALLDLELNGKPLYRFNRLQNRLYIDMNWNADVVLGGYVVAECYRALDPATFTQVWNEPWLRRYTTALFKEQWGTNLKKYDNMLLPGGVKTNGQEIYNEARIEIKELEDDLLNKAAPLDWFMG